MNTTPTITLKVDEDQLRSIVMKAVTEALSSTQAQYFNKRESAIYLKCSTVTLWAYERKGLINSIRVGGRAMFTKAELDRFASGQLK